MNKIFFVDNIIDLVCLIPVLIGILMYISGQVRARKNNNKPEKKDTNHNYAILIPARDESKVIEGLLKSIKEQSMKINMNDVYVIVEDKNDKTVQIANSYNATIIVRKHLELKRKGYALDEAIKEIIANNKKYDAYFIFDADNILDKDYLKNMTETYDLGYDIGIGYRNCKNGNDNVIAASSALTFSMINTLSNEMKKLRTNTMTVSGTGFYIRGYLIDEFKSYPFHSLTEDYELSLYTNLNNLTTDYNKKAIFYDEQPTEYKQTVNQRIRWIKGYMEARKEYIPLIKKKMKNDRKDNNYGSHLLEVIGVKPFIFVIVGLVLFFINQMYSLINQAMIGVSTWQIPVERIIDTFVILYFVMMIVTLMMIVLEKDKLNLDNKMKLKVIFFNPFYLVTYIPCAIKALLKK